MEGDCRTLGDISERVMKEWISSVLSFFRWWDDAYASAFSNVMKGALVGDLACAWSIVLCPEGMMEIWWMFS